MSAVGNFAALGNFGISNTDRTTRILGAYPSQQGQAFIPNPENNDLPYDSSAQPSHHPQSSYEFESSEDEKLAFNFGGDVDLEPIRSAAEHQEVKQQRQREYDVVKLARKATSMSSLSKSEDEKNNPIEPEEGSILDPRSPNFKPRAWTKALLRLQVQEPEKYKTRTAGFAFKNLNVFGFGTSTDYQKTVGNIALQLVGMVRKTFNIGQTRIDILRDFEGVVHSGEMLVVLGPPGSGCTTFLKTISGETHGFFVDDKSYLNYQGISARQMHKDFRGEAIYTAEVDVHFPMLNVFQTLSFAAEARAPRHIPGGMSRKSYGELLADVIMAVFGIGHTRNTRVGNDFIRGVSGGERKRVSIAEAALSGAPLQCWDNSTRGLDSANAIEFCKTVRMSTDLAGSTACVSIYQSPQSAYDIFDKVLVIYEGRQIYFGPCENGKDYFIRMGFYCPDRQTTADFLTSMTSPQERLVREGFEGRTPNTPDEFAARWKASPERAELLKEIDAFDKQYEIGGEYLEKFKESRRAQQSKHQRIGSPYTLSYSQQVLLTLRRGFWRLKGDPSLTFTQLFGNFLMALVIGSVFYNLQPNTSSFFSRGALLFFAILLNAFGSALEILTLYAQRPIVEKHSRYALYHPSAEAFASMLTDMPYKIANSIIFNLTIYFLTNLRRTPGAFFFFLLITFTLTLVMSMLFRFIASVSRTLSQAMAPAAILILGIVIYTGFAIPTRYMLGWSRWINYVDPVAYGFESLMINEFYAREFTCSELVPSGRGYKNVGRFNQVCSTVGSVAGSSVVSGTRYLTESFNYEHAHKWRNFGILFVFMFGLMGLYILATEYITAKKSKGEVLLFKRGHTPPSLKEKNAHDIEAGNGNVIGAQLQKDESAVIERQTAIFHWQDVCYDIKIKSETRRILDHVDGWVKPGTLTALMGESGAGKTTLLDVLATRTTMGVIDGQMLVDGRLRDESFQRKTGYVQQQDLHLATSTVREALNFSALLRQPSKVPKHEKLAYVDEVIKLLDMQEYADAVVGVPGEGLNVEQRKRLTIGVELVAKPALLLFLDEPTSGLDSQTSWAILDLLEKLTKNGQAVLCTIHQPSAMLFQRFDRLLLLEKGGKTVYFGEIGENSKTLTNYFERNGAHPCPPDANPAEWFLEVIGAAPGSFTEIDWFNTWRESPEYQKVHEHLDELKRERPKVTADPSATDDKASYREFAAHFWVQAYYTTKRVFEQYWRTPSYIYSKTSLCLFASLFIGFSFFRAERSTQGLQNQLFSVFMLFTIFGQLVQQIMPHFVTQRALYEARERPSKTYSWKAFILSNVIVEVPWNTLMAVIIFFCWYYPIGLYRNAEPTDTVTERGALMFLLIWTFMLFVGTFTAMVVAGIDTAETAGNIGNLLFSLTLIFCGVLAGPSVLPGFWIFMYRVSPFTYLVEGMLTTGVANTNVICDSTEYLHFTPPGGKTCGEYMHTWIRETGGYLQNTSATDTCSFCTVSSTNTFLASVNLNYANRWRDFGIMWAYIIFNVFGAIGFYWLARVPKRKRKEKLE